MPSRVTVNEVSSMAWSLEQDLERYAALGAGAIALIPMKLEPVGLREARRLIQQSGLRVSGYGAVGNFSLHEPDRLPQEIETVRRHIAVAAELGADTLSMISGSGRGRPYGESEAVFRHVIGQLLPSAESAGVTLAFENTGPMRVDIGFIHTLRDALDFADSIDSPRFRICFEISNAWMERFLYEDIAARGARIGLVQLSDFAEGTRTTPERVPLGDGIIPLGRILDAFAASAYAGWYEIEQLGPEIERLGYEESIHRSLEYLARRG